MSAELATFFWLLFESESIAIYGGMMSGGGGDFFTKNFRELLKTGHKSIYNESIDLTQGEK